MRRRSWLWAAGVYLVLSVAIALFLLPTGREKPLSTFPPPRSAGSIDVEPHVRDTLIRQSRVWRRDRATPAALTGESDPAFADTLVRCRYVDGPAHGTTPKFDCELPDGEVVKVKYGHTGEIHAELAATRLLTALGFGADRMDLVPHLRCYGCVRTPFYTMRMLDYVHARPWLVRSIPEDSYTDFEWVAVERRFRGREIESGEQDGWAWYELDAIDASKGADRAERDALRLVAVVLAHWDNKASNQRLVCLDDDAGRDGETAGTCQEPFAYIHDLGATFGPNKVDIKAWTAVPVWTDRARCLVSMRQMPYEGATFRDSRISEAGRRRIASQLAAIGDRQLVELFTRARFAEFHRKGDPGADVHAWVQAFRDKARQISDAGPCE